MVIHDKEKCMLCGGCVAVCPRTDVLELYDAFLEVNNDKCTNCGECVKVCPVEAMSLRK